MNAAKYADNLKSRARIYFDLSTIFGNIRNYEEKNKYLLLSVEANPKDHIAQAMLGRNYGFQSNWDKSEEHFLLSLEIEPNNPITKQWYANMQRARERQG